MQFCLVITNIILRFTLSNNNTLKHYKMSRETQNYKWGSWEATISKHPRRNEWSWEINDAEGNDTYNFYSHIDLEFTTPQEAEADMIREASNRVGSCPNSKF